MNTQKRPDITANLRTNIMDFRGFDSSIILILRGGMIIIMSMGDSPQSFSQSILVGRILVGIILVGRLGFFSQSPPASPAGPLQLVLQCTGSLS